MMSPILSLLSQVLWYKETMKLIEGERLHTEQIGDTYKLTIAKMRLQDYGDYYCKASNPLEKGESRAVVLTGAPGRPLLAGDSRSSELYSYLLAWEVQSFYSILQHEILYWRASSETQVDWPGLSSTQCYNITFRLTISRTPSLSLPRVTLTPGGCRD